MKYLLICLLSILSLPLSTYALLNRLDLPDSHAPISVMGDHTHHTGGWMFSYQYMPMMMAGIGNGTDSLSSSEFENQSDYEIRPKDMSMAMHMIGVMVAPFDQLTLMAMIPYHHNTMRHYHQHHDEPVEIMSHKSSGWGDISIDGLWTHINTAQHKSHLTLGLSIPTGKIDAKDNGSTLGYGMQLGSGTYDIKTAYTYTQFFDQYSVGFQAHYLARTGSNNQGYRLGNQGTVSVWLAKPWNHTLSSSIQLKYATIGKIEGTHDGITAMRSSMDPVLDASNSGGQYISAGLGSNLLLTNGLRLAAEYAVPIKQYWTGYQLRLQNVLTVGLQQSL